MAIIPAVISTPVNHVNYETTCQYRGLEDDSIEDMRMTFYL